MAGPRPKRDSPTTGAGQAQLGAALAEPVRRPDPAGDAARACAVPLVHRSRVAGAGLCWRLWATLGRGLWRCPGVLRPARHQRLAGRANCLQPGRFGRVLAQPARGACRVLHSASSTWSPTPAKAAPRPSPSAGGFGLFRDDGLTSALLAGAGLHIHWMAQASTAQLLCNLGSGLNTRSLDASAAQSIPFQRRSARWHEPRQRWA